MLYQFLRVVFSITIGLMFATALFLAVLGIYHFFLNRTTKKQYKNWRGKK